MEELDDLVRNQVKEERYRIFRWMSRSMNLSTRFMVPDEQTRDELGQDGSVAVGYGALFDSVDTFLVATSRSPN